MGREKRRVTAGIIARNEMVVGSTSAVNLITDIISRTAVNFTERLQLKKKIIIFFLKCLVP